MTYPTLSAKAADKIIQAQQSGEPIDIEEIVVWKDTDFSFSDQDARSLKAIVAAIRTKYPAALKTKSRQASDFEAEASPALHAAMAEGGYCADPEFWIWLTVVHFFDLVTWRYGVKFAPANFGIGAASENFLFRLWLRAELVFDPARSDHYELARKGSSLDFWRSHLFRQSYANARPFARALLQYQYPDAADEPRLETLAIRDLAKRLARVKSNLLVACLKEEEALYIIEAEAQSVTVKSA